MATPLLLRGPALTIVHAGACLDNSVRAYWAHSAMCSDRLQAAQPSHTQPGFISSLVQSYAASSSLSGPCPDQEEGSRVTDNYTPPCGFQELNPAPLEEQPVFLTTEPSLPPPCLAFKYLVLCESEDEPLSFLCCQGGKARHRENQNPKQTLSPPFRCLRSCAELAVGPYAL